MIDTEKMIQAINKLDLPHRKGWKPSDYIGLIPDGKHMKEEAKEVVEALQDFKEYIERDFRKYIESPDGFMVQATITNNTNTLKDHILEEMGDVFACLMQIAYRLDFSFEQINQEAVRKMRLRFANGCKVDLTTLEMVN